MKSIEIHEEVYKELFRLASSFEDKPNDVLRRLLGLNKVSPQTEKGERALEEMMKTIGIKDSSTLQRTRGRGNITPPQDYFVPILEALIELGDRGPTQEVLERVKKKMNDNFTEIDREFLPSGLDLRWRNKANWARLPMIKQGLLKQNSPRGIWEITESGKNYLKKAGDMA